MIKDRKPLALYEVQEHLKNIKESDKSKEVSEFIEKFMKSTPAKSKKIKQELENLGIIKLRTADIIKIVDVMPENVAELNKIFSEISLDADETNKILDTIKNNK
jgi:DNA-directed RNA polymerase subunit F